MKDQRIIGFHRMGWDKDRKEIRVGPPLSHRSTHGLWLVDTDQGFAVLVWENVFFGYYSSDEDGARQLKLDVYQLMNPDLRGLTLDDASQVKIRRVDLELWPNKCAEERGNNARTDIAVR